jgi:demethylmenaquinone methyltransferase/2-methoxy-6-polyprenyl-1,4-benzoquinol methylase
VSDDDEMLAEQRAYYRARAREYDTWWQGRGQYDRSTQQQAAWQRQVDLVAEALAGLDPSGDVLELAGGTGWWTERLARAARHLTVVDSSPEVIELNRARVRSSAVDYVVADLFTWQPERTYDMVFSSFWISHVPRRRAPAFWDLVRRCLGPGGCTFFVDNRKETSGPEGGDPTVAQYLPDLHVRHLADGTQYRVVKVRYEPDELSSLLTSLGWEAEVAGTQDFVYGWARPQGDGR